jgi:hypothetical protein
MILPGETEAGTAGIGVSGFKLRPAARETAL